MPRTAQKSDILKLRPADRMIFEEAADDLTLFCQYYFDGWTPLEFQHTFYHAPQKRKLLVAGVRTGKGERLTSSILTTDGWKKFGDLVVGDHVYGIDGNPTKIIAVHPIMLGIKSYEVVFSDGSVVPVSQDHLWLTHSYRYRKALSRRVEVPSRSWTERRPQCQTIYEPEILSVEDIKDSLGYRQQTNHAVPLPAPIQYPEIDLPLDPYLFGVWLGDGTTSRGVITTSDDEILESFRIGGYEPKWCQKYGYRISSLGDVPRKHNKFLCSLKELGVLGKKHIPEIYLRSSVEQRLALLQGLMDTDGTIDHRTGMCTFDQKSKVLTEDVKELIVSLGMQYRESSRVPKCNGKACDISHRLSFTPTVSVFRLKRKLEHQRLANIPSNRRYRYIVDVREIPSEPMRCITVEAEDGMYLTGRNLIPTHNSALVAAGFVHFAMYNPRCRIANASISADQAAIVYNNALDFVSRDKFQHLVKHVQRHPYPSITLFNDAQLWFRSIGYEAELWRGHEFDWINVDEAGYVPRQAAIDTLIGRLLGVRHVNGVPIQRSGLFTMTTSPKGKSWLFDWWKRGDPKFRGADLTKYFSLRARTRDNTYLSREAIEDLEASYTERQRQQELEGLFVDSADTVFPYEQIMWACNDVDVSGTREFDRPEVASLVSEIHEWLAKKKMSYQDGDLSYYSLEPERDHVYINSWDLGKKPTRSGRNALVGGVLDITELPWKLVAYRYIQGSSFGAANEYIKEWHHKYSNRAYCETVIDATGKGDPVNERLEEEERIPVEGIIYSAVTKPQLVMAAQMAFENGWIVFPFIRQMVDQLQAYELMDKEIPQDIVMMLSQALFRARQRTGVIGGAKVTVRPHDSFRRPVHAPDMDRFRDRRRSMRSAVRRRR
jgi:hypothetical protein